MTELQLVKSIYNAIKRGEIELSIPHSRFQTQGKSTLLLHLETDNDTEFAGVIEKLKKELAEQLKTEQIEELKKKAKAQKTLNSYTYLMIDTRTGRHKIGRSKRPDVRERTLQSEVPQTKLLAFCHESVVSESELHRVFSAKRVRGEWFDLSKKDVLEIKKLMQA